MRVLFLSTYLGQEPLGLMWLSGALKAAGHETRLMLLPDAAFPLKLRRYDPDVVCHSVTTGAHRAVAGLMTLVKSMQPRALTIAGGPHPTVVPAYLLEPGLDAICRGEGEAALVDLVNALEQGGDLRRIPNIHYKDAGGRIWENAPRPLAQDLDALGFPDRELLYEASDLYGRAERKVFKTDRGCPMNCSFCFHHAWKKKVYKVTNNEYVRRRSVDHVIQEARQL
ncbi:MAG TPA: cobalamin-dependent protein, partial [Planctomycetota bacterium]|nr:cobalamin-dependent protein [Planctomycetota bacterium]